MGFLSHLIKIGQKPFRSGLVPKQMDVLGMASGAYKTPKTPPAAATPTTSTPGATDQYAGDPSDPAYGSFAKPFDAQAFLDYQDPGYAFELAQGTQAVQNAASAGSGAFSGAALKDLLNYSQNFARTGYNDAFNRYQTQQGNIFNRLSSLATLGQNAAAGVGSQGTALAGNAGQAIQQGGAAAGAGLVGAGNALNQGATNYWLFGTPQGRQLWGGTPG